MIATHFIHHTKGQWHTFRRLTQTQVLLIEVAVKEYMKNKDKNKWYEDGQEIEWYEDAQNIIEAIENEKISLH